MKSLTKLLPSKNKQKWKKQFKTTVSGLQKSIGDKQGIEKCLFMKSVRTLDDKSGSLQRVCSPLAWICSSLIPPPSLVSEAILPEQDCPWKTTASLVQRTDLLWVEGQNPSLAALSVKEAYVAEVNGKFS